MGYQLIEIFGKQSHTFRKYQRMMYWLPKFKYSNPYYVPYDLPNDRIELAKMALQRMAVDLENEVSIFEVNCLVYYCQRMYRWELHQVTNVIIIVITQLSNHTLNWRRNLITMTQVFIM